MRADPFVFSVGDLEEKKEDISLAVSNETCSAKSYLLADGVCDEVTNRERCFYDGGDCCLESYKKDTKFCQDCSCRGGKTLIKIKEKALKFGICS